MSKVVWLIRHGQSEANADINYRSNDFSVPMVELTALGREQAESVLSYFRDIDQEPELIVTSSYIRTKQTAEPTINRYTEALQEEWPVQEFTYLSVSNCYDTTFAERRPMRESYWQQDPSYNDGEGAESFDDFMTRCSATIQMLRERPEKFIVIFSHAYTIAAIKYLIEKAPAKITTKEMREFAEFFQADKLKNAGRVIINL